MCQHILILAERSPQQYISQCEHGTVNLVWDGVGIHLPAAQFVVLAERIQHAHERLLHTGAPPEGQCHLQVGKLVVLLPISDFTPLIHIINEALPAIEKEPMMHPQRVPTVRFPIHPLANVLN